MKTPSFCYSLLKHVWLFSQKIKGHQTFIIFQLLLSQVAPPSKQGHVSPKACCTGFNYTSPSMDGDSSNSGYLQGGPSSNQATHILCSFPFCHTDFINREEVIEQIEICLGTYPEPEVQKLICPYCQQIFDRHDKIENHIGIHITRYIRTLHNRSQQLQQPGRVNQPHKHLAMKRF